MTIIDKVDSYRAEDGTQHEVLFLDRNIAYGRNVKGGPSLWDAESGKILSGQPSSWSLVAKWSDPVKPAEGWVLRKSIDPNRPSDSPEYIFVRQVVDEKPVIVKG